MKNQKQFMQSRMYPGAIDPKKIKKERKARKTKMMNGKDNKGI